MIGMETFPTTWIILASELAKFRKPTNARKIIIVANKEMIETLEAFLKKVFIIVLHSSVLLV